MKRLPVVLAAVLLSAFLTGISAQPVQPVKAHTQLVHTIAVSPDGKLAATGGFDNLVKIWDIAPDGTLKEKKVLTGHTGPVYCVAFHPKDAVLVSVSQDKTGRVWALADGKTTFEIKGHTGIVDTVAYSPDGKTIATGSEDKSVKLWNSTDGKELKALGTHGGSVYTVAFAPDGKTLASASADNLVKIWDVPGQKELKQLKGHEQPVTTVAFAGDPNVLVSASMDRTIRVWNVADGKETMRLGPTTDDPYAVAWWQPSKTLVVCGYSGQVTTWALDDPGHQSSSWSPWVVYKPKFTKQIKSPGYCIAFTGDGKGVLTGHDNGTVVFTALMGK
jgi:WD40 repeat protein